MHEQAYYPLPTRLQAVRDRIKAAAQSAGRRAEDIRLLAVSKGQPAAQIAAATACGQWAFGENYLQEWQGKQADLEESRIEWHFIGPVQANKTRALAVRIDWVQSVDRLKIAQRLNDQRPATLPPLQVCIQVNISNEASKSGVALSQLPALAEAIAALPRLRLRGLMAIPAPTTDPNRQRAAFARLHAAYVELCDRGLALDTLSMGMSDDLEAAIVEGSTLVRIGSAIFGPRQRGPAPLDEP